MSILAMELLVESPQDFYNFQRTKKNLNCRCAYLTVYQSVSSLQPSNLPTGKRHTARIFEHMPWKLFSLLKKKLCICYARIQALILICLRKLKKRNETTLKLRLLFANIKWTLMSPNCWLLDKLSTRNERKIFHVVNSITSKINR